METARHRRRYSRGTYLSLVLAEIVLATLAALFGAEGLLRLFGIGSDQMLRPDPVLGVRFIESKRGLNQGTCFRATVGVNSQGWRGAEFSPRKPDGVYRIVLLGDSYMAGMQVNDDEVFAAVLERELNAPARTRRVEVVNIGVPSWGTDQEYLALREIALAYQPDLVVVAFYAQNDVSDNHPKFVADPARDLKPFFGIVDGELEQISGVAPKPMPLVLGFRFATHFRLYPVARNVMLQSNLMHEGLYRLRLVDMPPETRRAATVPDASFDWPRRWREQTEVYSRRDAKIWTAAWNVTELLLVSARDEAARAGARFMLVDIAPPVSVLPPSMVPKLMTDVRALDFDMPTRRLREIAERRGFHFTSLVPVFRQAIGDSEAALAEYFLRCDGHWTPAGHRLAAQALARDLQQQIPQLGSN
jgi:hypothetical protein